MNPLILIVEDEPAQVEMLHYNLDRAAYRTVVACDGEEALLKIEEEEPDLVILDWMLPLVSGLEVCRRIRAKDETRHLPVIMVTARGEDDDRVRGFDLGVDDYLVKPFLPSELLARVRAVLRRSLPGRGEQVLESGDLVMNLSTQRVSRSGAPVHLSPTELRLLRTLLERPGHVFSRETILDRVLGRDVYVELRTVDVHIGRLRKALNSDGQSDLIRTVRGSGYALETDRI